MTLSPSQRRVLEWLYAYPGVYLNAVPGSNITWTAMWANDRARMDMMTTIEQLFGADAGFAQPHGKPISGPTPRCSVHTFRALQRAGYLRPAKRSHGELPRHFHISNAGLTALKDDLDAGVPRQPVWPRPMQRCACGWRGRSVGGHASSARHRTWLVVEEYRRVVLASNAALST